MKLKNNVPLIYIISSLMWGRFFIPVLALFYISSKVSLDQFSIIMAVFALSTLLLEIPTGVIADLLGKKKTLLLARFCYIIEIFLIAFFNGFWIFLIAKTISGVGVSLSSGTNSALLYDTLKVQGKEKQHKKISGNIETITNISMATVFIIGAFLFSINPKLPAIMSLPLIILGFILTFFIQEPYKNEKNLTYKNSVQHLKEGLTYFSKLPFVKYISLFSLFTAAAISIALSMSSAYYKEILIPVYLMGLCAFLVSIMAAYSSKKSHVIEEKLGERKSLLIIQILIVLEILFISLTIPYVGVIFLLLIGLTSGFYTVVTNDYVNSHITASSHRATLLSIKNMFDNIGIFILFPLVGYLTKVKSMDFSFFILGIIILIGYIVVYFYKKINKINSKNHK